MISVRSELPTELSRLAWIDGRAVESSTTFDVMNPASGEVIALVADARGELVEKAIKAADDAFDSWARTTPEQRAGLLNTWADKITAHSEAIAAIASAESGKLFREARGEVEAGVGAIRWSAQMALETREDILEAPSPTRKNFTTRQPVGVVAAITPWNFPIAAVLVKVGAAIAAGCTVVLKPSEETPLVALYLAELSREASIPDGVINVVAMAKPSVFGEAIAASSAVRALSFTGSTPVGKQLYQACAGTVKRIGLELGGNAPFVVFADADLERAVGDAVNARFYNAGQICVGANRFLVHEAVYDQFASKLAQRVLELSVGPGADDSSDLGPLINRQAKIKFEGLLSNAIENGAIVKVGAFHQDSESLFVEPVVLTEVTTDMDAHQTEIFGPMACLYRFSDDDDIIAMANDTDAGLAAYAYSENHEFLAEVGTMLQAGVVGLNTTQIFASDLPFGGIKESGIGREHGIDCLDEFTDLRSISFETGGKP